MTMAHSYGTGSRAKLHTCHPTMVMIAERALELSPYDITIIHGWRGEEVQNALYDSHASHKQFPDSRHNKSDDPDCSIPLITSDAIDFAPYVDGAIDWEDTHIFAVIAGCFMAAAAQLGYTLRWGGDWDGDGWTTDQTLMDWGHVEIMWDKL